MEVVDESEIAISINMTPHASGVEGVHFDKLIFPFAEKAFRAAREGYELRNIATKGFLLAPGDRLSLPGTT
jgi:hypothetical protein